MDDSAVTILDRRDSPGAECTSTSRHFMPKEFVKKYIDLLALHKMNSFHWHLTDDQGWRIEIKKYPRLTSAGAWRSQTLVGKAQRDSTLDVYDRKPHGGFYTQDDVREIVEYARARFVRIVPEIEMPGHSQAAIAAYPSPRQLAIRFPCGRAGRHATHPESVRHDHRVHAGRPHRGHGALPR
jgi:hexosaminidase